MKKMQEETIQRRVRSDLDKMEAEQREALTFIAHEKQLERKRNEDKAKIDFYSALRERVGVDMNLFFSCKDNRPEEK
jgi:hypothetical protein